MNLGKIKIILICIGLWPLLKLAGMVHSPEKALTHKPSIKSVTSHDRGMANEVSSVARFILPNNQDAKKINGLWLLVRSNAFQLDSGKETERSIGEKENHFYIRIWKDSIVHMTGMSKDVESKDEYYISSLNLIKKSAFFINYPIGLFGFIILNSLS